MASTKALEHEESLPRDLIVKGSPEALNQMWAKLEKGHRHWRRNRPFEREYAKMSGEKDADRTRVFVYVGSDFPACGLWLFRKPDSLEVTNIVPKSGRLEPPVYNQLAERFAADVLEPRATRGIKVELGPEDLRLEDLVSERTGRALRAFSGAANKKTGNAHASDGTRWLHFVRLAHDESSELDAGFLTQWLLGEGWDERWAVKLGEVYESQRDVLRAEPVKQLPIATDRDWKKTVRTMRSSTVVVLVDACAYLELLRLPDRASSSKECAVIMEAVVEVIERSARPTHKLALASLEAVNAEVQRNRPNVLRNTEQQLSTALRRIQIMMALATIKGALPDAKRALERSEELIDRLLASTTMFTTTEEIQKRAFVRSTTHVAPASPGKESLVDCMIAETALELGRALGSKTNTFLLSLNTKDFSGPDLINELSGANVTFVRSWQELAGRLKSNRPR